jgi:hypothetical protein
MRTIPAFWLFSFALVTMRAEPVFEAYMTTSAGSIFVLSALDGKKSGWIAPQQSFDGYVVISFDQRSERLTLEKSGKRVELRLKAPAKAIAQPQIEHKVQSTDERLQQLRKMRDAAVERKRILDERLKEQLAREAQQTR